MKRKQNEYWDGGLPSDPTFRRSATDRDSVGVGNNKMLDIFSCTSFDRFTKEDDWSVPINRSCDNDMLTSLALFLASLRIDMSYASLTLNICCCWYESIEGVSPHSRCFHSLWWDPIWMHFPTDNLCSLITYVTFIWLKTHCSHYWWLTCESFLFTMHSLQIACIGIRQTKRAII